MNWPGASSVLPDGVSVQGITDADNRSALDAAGIADVSLRRDFSECKALLKHHGTSYAYATMLLPKESRPFVWALYGFARYADEFVDNLAEPNPDALRPFADRFMASATKLLADSSTHQEDVAATELEPASRAMLWTMARHNIDLGTVESFFESMTADIDTTRYPTTADLDHYMYGSASIVGLQMLPLLEPTSPDAADGAKALGEAFQLTNFLRDVGEDADRGRCYIPEDVLAAHGLCVEDVFAARRVRYTPGPLKAALKDVAAETKRRYARAIPGLAMLSDRCRPAIECAYRLYGGILTEIEKRDYDVIPERIRVSRRRKLAIVAATYGAAKTPKRTPRRTSLS